MKKNIATAAKSALAAALCAASLAGAAATPAVAKTVTTPYAAPYYGPMRYANHYEGEPVTIGDDWGQPVYAKWHKGDSGRWWATFWTYNGTRVWACPADAGCGWIFFVYDSDGDFVQVIRCEESSVYGQVGPEGVSSHWQELDGTRWF